MAPKGRVEETINECQPDKDWWAEKVSAHDSTRSTVSNKVIPKGETYYVHYVKFRDSSSDESRIIGEILTEKEHFIRQLEGEDDDD